jgi:hypothetical protein
VTTYRNPWDRDEGDFHQVATVEMRVKDALELGLLDQITDHVEDCSDSNPRQRGYSRNGLIDSADYVRCPRCALLLASQSTATGYLLDSPLRLRVIAQIKHRSPFDYINWD